MRELKGMAWWVGGGVEKTPRSPTATSPDPGHLHPLQKNSSVVTSLKRTFSLAQGDSPEPREIAQGVFAMQREGFPCSPWDDRSRAHFVDVGEIQAADRGA